MSLGRFVQVTAAIQQRRYIERRQQRSLLAWQTRTLASYIGATAFGGAEELVQQASSIFLDEDEALAHQEASKKPKKREPQAGSYEKLLMFAGEIQKPR